MKTSNFLRWGLIVILVVVCVGIILSDFSAGIYLATGLVILILGMVVAKYLNRKTIILGISILFGVVLVGVLFALIPINTFLGPAGPAYPICTEGDIRSQFVITNYSAEIETENFAEDSFLVKRQITYKEVEQTCVYRDWESKTIRESITEDLPGETIQGSRVGLFLHEVELPTKLNNYSCCPDTASVAVTNLPYHSFFDAQYARDLNVDEYLGKETITWEGNYPERGIRFAYIPSPFHNVHSLLTPFIELSKFDNWALALLGFTVSSLFVAVVKSSVVDWMKGKFKELFKKEKDTKKDDQPK